ncbi:hypothetical protein JCM10207_009175 [Rhodosporidiobolus poonsookiae]
MFAQALLRTARTPALVRPAPLRLAARSFAASAPQLSSLSDGEAHLKTKLEDSLKGAKVEVQDVSGGCGSFYAISIAHESFKGLSMIKQHRIVNDLLKDEIKGMHGLQLKTKAP